MLRVHLFDKHLKKTPTFSALLLHRGEHIQQPDPAKGNVQLVQGHRDPLQHEPPGAVDPRQQAAGLGRHRNAGAGDPGQPAAAGAQDRRRHQEHLRHVQQVDDRADPAHPLPLHAAGGVRGEAHAAVHRQSDQQAEGAAPDGDRLCSAAAYHRH